jgi:hypothetical protein
MQVDNSTTSSRQTPVAVHGLSYFAGMYCACSALVLFHSTSSLPTLRTAVDAVTRHGQRYLFSAILFLTRYDQVSAGTVYVTMSTLRPELLSPLMPQGLTSPLVAGNSNTRTYSCVPFVSWSSLLPESFNFPNISLIDLLVMFKAFCALCLPHSMRKSKNLVAWMMCGLFASDILSSNAQELMTTAQSSAAPEWVTAAAQLIVQRQNFAAASVGNIAVFAGGGTCTFPGKTALQNIIF